MIADPEQPGWFNALSEDKQQEAVRIMQAIVGAGTPYVFHRSQGFYPLTLGSDEEAIANAKCNPGTLSVENCMTGKTVWTAP